MTYTVTHTGKTQILRRQVITLLLIERQRIAEQISPKSTQQSDKVHTAIK